MIIVCHVTWLGYIMFTLCKVISLPPMSAVEVIESVLSVCVAVWVCGTYVVHHFNTEWYRVTLCTIVLLCAPLTCVVHR